MKNVKRKELIEKANEHELRLFQIEKALEQHGINWFSDEPKLKQLDQSIFDGLDEKWRFAMVSSVGAPFVYDYKPTGNRVFFSDDATQEKIKDGRVMRISEYDYDTSNWQNSLIERDIAELLEFDLSSELMGSDLCRAMLERGDKAVMCKINESNSMTIIIGYKESRLGGWVFHSHRHSNYYIITPINNQGEPLTASEVGL